MRAFRLERRTWVLLAALLALVLICTFYHQQIRRAWSIHLLLRSNNPRDEFFNELAREGDDPVDFLQRCWATGKIPHRQLVASFLNDHASTNSTWPARADPLLLAGTLDADASVRELALAALAARHSPLLFEAARAQLADLDPLLRLLGLDYLRKSDSKPGVPVLISLLDDADPRIVATAEVGLMRWSGEDYGVRVHMAVPSREGAHPEQIDASDAEVIRRGAQQRKEWWRVHQQNYGSPPGSGAKAGPASSTGLSRPPAPDFTLRDLEGRKVNLSDFRGRVVLLNFWATWCTSCLFEIPDLVALQDKLGSQVVILGVALDGVPDEHGDTPGEDADEKSAKPNSSLNSIRAKVEHAVLARHINYRVLLDPANHAGGQYNGGELPTTVIIDAEGRMRRRFIGERNPAVLEAMLAEAAKPSGTAGTRAQPPAN